MALPNNFPQQIIVTGTDTGVGKTIVSAYLCQQLKAAYYKPIQTGDDCDSTEVSSLTGCQYIEPTYCLKAPLSPLAASRLEKTYSKLDLESIPLKVLQAHSAINSTDNREPLVIEGAGGVMVPITERETMLDLFQLLNLPVVIVSRGNLGTLNHTLLTVNALQQHNIDIAAIIISGENQDNNGEILKELTGLSVYNLPFIKNLNPKTLAATPLQQL